jgi:hypothetical protein
VLVAGHHDPSARLTPQESGAVFGTKRLTHQRNGDHEVILP